MRTYRVGATMGPLLGWNLFAAILIAVLVSAAIHGRPHEKADLYGVAGILILLGPVCLVPYLIRYYRVWVKLDGDSLVASNRYRIAYSDIRAVQLRGYRHTPWNPFRSIEMTGCSWVIFFFLFKLVVLVLLVVGVLWILWTVMVPVLVLYSPWHSKVVIEMTDGTRLVYRDLEDAEEFAQRLWEVIPV